MIYNKKINLCFISGHYFGFKALCGLLDSEVYRDGKLRVSSLITLDSKKERSTVGYFDFAEIANTYNIQHNMVKSINSFGVIDIIENAKPDFVLVIGWSELVPATILNLPMTIHNSNHRHLNSHGCIGMHPTLLPQGRGRAPIPWTIIKRLKETGVSAFLLEESADSGGIVLQERIFISEDETATSLFTKCADMHYDLAQKLAPMLSSKVLTWSEQDSLKSSTWEKRTPEDGLINFNNCADDIRNLVNALTRPYPGAFFYYKGTKIIVDEVALHTQTSQCLIGTIVEMSSAGLPFICAKDGIVECKAIHVVNGDTPIFFIDTWV